MRFSTKVFIFFVILFFINISIVSAADVNSTDIVDTSDDVAVESNGNDFNASTSQNNSFEKSTPVISVKSKSIKSRDTLEFDLKNSSGTPLKNMKLSVSINNKKYSISTNSKGIAKLPITLAAKTYKLSISFDGNEYYNPISKDFNIKVSKLNTNMIYSTNFVTKGKYLYFYLYDQNWDSVAYKKVIFKLKGKTYTKTTNKNGLVKFKINLAKAKYSINAKFKADNYYKSSSCKLTFYVISPLYITIENSKLLTHGYLRVYLKHPNNSIYKKKITLTIAGKKLTKKTNSNGIAVFKPDAAAKTYKISVKLGKYASYKKIRCYEGNVKDPLKEKIPLKNGKPDIDVMPGNYVTADENAKYTLTKSQYMDVLKRDSYCLFLNSKLTKYTFFKTKNHPNTFHIIKRQKWNVIEREINKKLVKANKNGYWPSKITVFLKGKSYTYPEIRDVQNTGYTCGPTSASMCSQVLKNYVCEKYLAKLSGSKSGEGTTCYGMQKALEKNNFRCEYFYKSSFNYALNELKNGGCALIFHANKHYVSILDVSSDGKKVLVSNSYGNYDNIPTKWVSVSYMKGKFSHWEESLIVRLDYKLSESTKNSVDCYYNSMGANWAKHNTNQAIGRV